MTIDNLITDAEISRIPLLAKPSEKAYVLANAIAQRINSPNILVEEIRLGVPNEETETYAIAYVEDKPRSKSEAIFFGGTQIPMSLPDTIPVSTQIILCHGNGNEERPHRVASVYNESLPSDPIYEKANAAIKSVLSLIPGTQDLERSPIETNENAPPIRESAIYQPIRPAYSF